MREWRNCTFLQSVLSSPSLNQEQADYFGVKVEGPFNGEHYCWTQGSAESVVADTVFKVLEGNQGLQDRCLLSTRLL